VQATKVAKQISGAKSGALDCKQKYIILPTSSKREDLRLDINFYLF